MNVSFSPADNTAHYHILNCTLSNKVIVIACDSNGIICWALVVIGCVTTVIFFIAVIVCMIFTRIVAKGIRFMTQHFSTSARANGERDIEQNQYQQQEPQNEGIAMFFNFVFIVLQ